MVEATERGRYTTDFSIDYITLHALYAKTEAENEQLKKEIRKAEKMLASAADVEDFHCELEEENADLKDVLIGAESNNQEISLQLSYLQKEAASLEYVQVSSSLELHNTRRRIKEMTRCIDDAVMDRNESRNETKKIFESYQEAEQVLKNITQNHKDKISYLKRRAKELKIERTRMKNELKEKEKILHDLLEEANRVLSENDSLGSRKRGFFSRLFACFRRRSTRR